jgi:TPR repeat protein
MGSSQSTDTNQNASFTPMGGTADDSQSPFPTPTGHEDDVIDKIAAELPNFIDDESRQQVEDYKEACNDGKGPMAACFATGEYISLFERKHKQAADLYHNVCFRPRTDKSPNGVPVDGTKAFPAGCFNLAKMKLTGKGGVRFDRAEAYQLLDRACRAGHGGACYLQAQILCAPPGAMGPGVPNDPRLAIDLYQKTCENGDSISCFTLASMLLRGDRVDKMADNVSPTEARGLEPIVQRENEPDRAAGHTHYVVPRDAPRAKELLRQGCESGSHVTSCHNLAVMFEHGDDGVAADPIEAEKYKKMTKEKMDIYGGF